MPQREHDPEVATERLVAKLNNPRAVFTRDQVAFLLGTSARWAREVAEEEPSDLSYRAGYDAGYRARVDEENASYPPPQIFVAGGWMERVDYRRECDRAAVAPREGDMVPEPVS